MTPYVHEVIEHDGICPCCSNVETLLVERIRIVSAEVSVPFHDALLRLIESPLAEIRLTGRDLVSFPPQRRQTEDFARTVRSFGAAVQALCAALDATALENESDIPDPEFRRVFRLRRALVDIARYAEVLAEEALTVEEGR